MNDGGNDIQLTLCTCPDDATAQRLARGLVENRLAACVNLLPGIRSIYRWQEAVEDEAEVLMIIKSTRLAAAALRAWLLSEHPYDEPEVIHLDVAGGSAGYLEWVAESVQASAAEPGLKGP